MLGVQPALVQTLMRFIDTVHGEVNSSEGAICTVLYLVTASWDECQQPVPKKTATVMYRSPGTAAQLCTFCNIAALSHLAPAPSGNEASGTHVCELIHQPNAAMNLNVME